MAKARKRKEKQFNVYSGRYFSIADNKRLAELKADKVNDREKDFLLMEPKPSSKTALNRAVSSHPHAWGKARVPRITPKTPRLR